MKKIDEVNITKRELVIKKAKELLRLQEKLEFATINICPDRSLEQLITKNEKQIKKAKAMLQIVNLMQDLENK